MATKTSMSAAQPIRAFYLPGTAINSTTPGRFQRFVLAHLRDIRVKARVTTFGERIREFYLPATPRR